MRSDERSMMSPLATGMISSIRKRKRAKASARPVTTNNMGVRPTPPEMPRTMAVVPPMGREKAMITIRSLHLYRPEVLEKCHSRRARVARRRR